MPIDAEGIGTLTSTGLIANPVLIEFTGPAPTDVISARESEAPASDPAATTQRSMLIDKPPPLAVSVYEPVYFILGGDDGLNAKFQISLRYRLFDGRGQLAEKLPWIDDLYLSYSQTSLWDLGDLSKPFRDSSYRPRLFFSNYDLGRLLDGRLRLGIEAGAGHESNGKEGEESRSFNMLYARPVLTFGDPEGLRAYLAPLIHNYISEDENPNIQHYRGYVDWLFGFGSKGGLDFSATARRGTRSDYGSVELNASYPLSKLSGGDLTGWLMLQYFGGYGESLLDFDRKLDAQFRLGIAIAL
jgi:outer membrane phospholipase A